MQHHWQISASSWQPQHCPFNIFDPTIRVFSCWFLLHWRLRYTARAGANKTPCWFVYGVVAVFLCIKRDGIWLRWIFF